MHRRVGNLRVQVAGRRATAWTVVAASLIGVSACGGGGSSGSSRGAPPAGPAAGSAGTGTVRVTVSDVFGEAVAGASVWVSSGDITLATGLDGVVQFDDVPAGPTRVCARHPVRGHTCSAPDPVTVERNSILVASRQLEQFPSVDDVATTVLSATVQPGGVGADGRTLDVTLRVGVIGPQYLGSWIVIGDEWGYNRPQVFDCTARSGDDLAQLGPRCIRSADGSDQSYSFGQVNDVGPVESLQVPAIPRAVGLLIDQSDGGLSPDWIPNDPRLFAAKLFTHRLRLSSDTPLLLAGFASDEPSGSAASLPQRPVTFFPVESPGFVSSWPEDYGDLQDLSALVGGGAPLYAAIATGIEFMAANAPAGRQRALVVLADGADTTCGTPVQCAALRRQVVTRARDAGVQLFIVGGSPSDCTPDWVGQEDCDGNSADRDAIQLLAREGGFPIVIAAQPRLVGPLELARQWILGSVLVQDVSLRLQSDTAGAFAPGATVMGKLTVANASQCPMGCTVHELIFSVEIPR